MDRQIQLSAKTRQHSVTSNASKCRNFFGSVWTECLCQNFQLEQILQSRPDPNLSQEKLTQILLGQGQPPQLHCWDCPVIGLKELESGIVTNITLKSTSLSIPALGIRGEKVTQEVTHLICSITAFTSSGICPDSSSVGPAFPACSTA